MAFLEVVGGTATCLVVRVQNIRVIGNQSRKPTCLRILIKEMKERSNKRETEEALVKRWLCCSKENNRRFVRILRKTDGRIVRKRIHPRIMPHAAQFLCEFNRLPLASAGSK